MRKFLVTCVFLISLILLLPAATHASSYRSEVKVGLIYGGSTISVNLSSSGGVTVYNAVTGSWLYSSAFYETVSISMTGNGFSSADKFYADGVTKISVQPQNGATISLNGKEYRGYIYMEKHSSGKLSVINVLGTDDYVASVLGKEMSYSWPAEALKAQSVCARNFVLSRGNAHTGFNFDVCSTTHCQVYGGVSSEHPNTVAATKATKGILAYYNGSIVPLYFYATSGGYTEASENVWSSALGYLKSVPDPYENPSKASYYRWTSTLTHSQVESKLRNAGHKIGSLQSFSIDSVSPSGRVTKMTFYGTDGKCEVYREKCRTLFGFNGQRFSVNNPLPDDNAASLHSTAGAISTQPVALSATGTSPVSSYYAINGNGEISRLNSSVSQIGTFSADSYTFYGSGYGHGIGMSQWGARGMAENGFTYDQILHHYYTDIVLK